MAFSRLRRMRAKDVARVEISPKGKKVTRVDLKKDRPDDDTLVSLMLGPTGNLRAPTMKVGKTVLIGFNDDIYDEIFG